jgi:hypothetical protein
MPVRKMMNEREPARVQVEATEEIFWACEEEDRLATFDHQTAVPHEDAWKEQAEKAE